MNINNFEELFKYLDGLSTYKRATIDFQSFSEKARKEWNIQNYKNLAEVVFINVGRVEEISFISDKNCKYQEKENKYKQEELWKK